MPDEVTFDFHLMDANCASLSTVIMRYWLLDLLNRHLQVALPVNVVPVTFPGHGHAQAFNLTDDLPKVVARTISQVSSPMSMDFHPFQLTLLLGMLC